MMYKLSIVVTVLTLTGCASSSAWRDLQIDGSSESSIKESVASIQQALPDWRRERFDMVLSDLWVTGTIKAETEGTEYTASDYFAQLDGLGYDEVLDIAGPDTTPRYWSIVHRQWRNASAQGLSPPEPDAYRFPSYEQHAKELAELIR